MKQPSRTELERLMDKALDLAECGRFRVEPNPLVGAVVVDAGGNFAVSQCHWDYGGPHAELRAIEMASHRTRGGTLVVTLEPCAHTAKKTPPCVPAVIAAGVRRVVVGAADPNPATTGRAAEAFAAAGIEYVGGVREEACRGLIGRYAAHLSADRPWAVAKWAMSLDGRTADAARAARWISNSFSRNVVHDLRTAVEAVVVGRGTVETDDPSLVSDSAAQGRNATRVVLDSALRVSVAAKLIVTAREIPTLVVGAVGADAARRAALEAAGAEVALVSAGADGRIDVAEAFRELRRRGFRRVMIEAGGELQAACFRAGVVDQVAAFVAPVVLGGGGPTPFMGGGWPIADAPRLEEVRVTPVGEDALIEGYWPRTWDRRR